MPDTEDTQENEDDMPVMPQPNGAEHHEHHINNAIIFSVVAALVVSLGVGWFVLSSLSDDDDNSENNAATSQEETTDQAETVEQQPLVESKYLGNYSLEETEFGTEVTVTVNETADTRTIVANAIPNHSTGEFPNDANPNAISEQSATYTYPLTPNFTGNAVEARIPGVALNGVKFEPGTAETFTCASGETYRVEAIQDLTSLGLDFNNAHVQPTGEYHYHGISTMMADAFDSGGDLVHVGFAADGHLIYYSKSGAYTSSYELGSGQRSGSGCEFSLSNRTDVIFSTAKDGAITSDWDYVEGAGDLDECNGTEINGEYAYVMTTTFPFISRCLKGEFTETTPSGGGGAPGGSGPGAGQMGGPPPGGGMPPQPPRF